MNLDQGRVALRDLLELSAKADTATWKLSSGADLHRHEQVCLHGLSFAHVAQTFIDRKRLLPQLLAAGVLL